MLIKTNDLENEALDWAAATALGFVPVIDDDSGLIFVEQVYAHANEAFSPSTNPLQAYQIMDKVDLPQAGIRIAAVQVGALWFADNPRQTPYICMSGPTRLIAAMRCLVALKLGLGIEIPDQLVCAKKDTIQPAENKNISARALREQAAQLLHLAFQIDGLRPYTVTHTHRFGESTYMAWSQKKPDETQAVGLLDCEYEPDREETLAIESNFTMDELVGLKTVPKYFVRVYLTARGSASDWQDSNVEGAYCYRVKVHGDAGPLAMPIGPSTLSALHSEIACAVKDHFHEHNAIKVLDDFTISLLLNDGTSIEEEDPPLDGSGYDFDVECVDVVALDQAPAVNVSAQTSLPRERG